MRRLRAGAPVVVAAVTSLWLPPLLLVWLVLLVRDRIRHGTWGLTLGFLSRGARRVFVVLWAIGFAVVTGGYASQLEGNGGADIAATVGTAVTVGLLVIVALDLVFGATIVVAGAASRRSRRGRHRR